MIIKPNNNLPSGMFYEKSLICERRNLNTVKVKEFSLTAAIYNEALRSITTFLAGQIKFPFVITMKNLNTFSKKILCEPGNY